jgi:NCS1 family nucleobase:cation symporter-1
LPLPFPLARTDDSGMRSTVAAHVVQPDGRVELADPATLDGSPYANAELAPVPVEKRTWNTYNYAALWVGMSHNLPTYALAAGLIAIGMNAWQALLTIALGNLIVLLPMLLNSHAGTKYGIPFPVFARAFYGVRGANVAAILRALIACGWFGIQTWLGGEGIYEIFGKLAGNGWLNAASFAGQPWTLWLSFAIFWVIQIGIIWRGMDTVRRFENWAAPFVLIVFVALLVWMLTKAGGFGPLLSEPGKLGWGSAFWKVFPPSLMGMIAFWSTLSLNMPDFTRFAKSQRGQSIGQVLGLPTTMTFFSLIAVLITSATITVYGSAIWDPIKLAAKFSNPAIVILGLVTVLVATVSVNVAANVVSPSYDFSNIAPKWISFRTGGIITGVIGVAIQPWRLLSNPHVYIFTWLGFYGGLIGAVAGVLVAGYWVINRTNLDLPDLYRKGGRYWFSAGWNWRSIVATVIGAVLAVGGANSASANDGPFPTGGLIPLLKPLYDYSWAVGFAAGFLVYLALSMPAGRREPVVAAVATEGSA